MLPPVLQAHVEALRHKAYTLARIADAFEASVMAYDAAGRRNKGRVPNMITWRQPDGKKYVPGVEAIPAAMVKAVEGDDRFGLNEVGRTAPELLDQSFEAIIVREATYFTEHFGAAVVELCRDRLAVACEATMNAAAAGDLVMA